jgi:hypothetical protein
VDSKFKTLSRVESVHLRIIHHNISVGLTNTNSYEALVTTKLEILRVTALFVWLITHQPVLLLSQNEPVIGNQPTIFFSKNKSAPTTGLSNVQTACCNFDYQ